MTTTRRPIRHGKQAITKAAVETYRRMQALRKPGDDSAQSKEYFEACRELDRLMQREVWQTSILEVLDESSEAPSSYRHSQHLIDEWREAHSIGVELQKAAARE